MASAGCGTAIRSDPARSAIVRATRSARGRGPTSQDDWRPSAGTGLPPRRAPRAVPAPGQPAAGWRVPDARLRICVPAAPARAPPRCSRRLARRATPAPAAWDFDLQVDAVEQRAAELALVARDLVPAFCSGRPWTQGGAAARAGTIAATSWKRAEIRSGAPRARSRTCPDSGGSRSASSVLRGNWVEVHRGTGPVVRQRDLAQPVAVASRRRRSLTALALAVTRAGRAQSPALQPGAPARAKPARRDSSASSSIAGSSPARRCASMDCLIPDCTTSSRLWLPLAAISRAPRCGLAPLTFGQIRCPLMTCLILRPRPGASPLSSAAALGQRARCRRRELAGLRRANCRARARPCAPRASAFLPALSGGSTTRMASARPGATQASSRAHRGWPAVRRRARLARELVPGQPARIELGCSRPGCRARAIGGRSAPSPWAGRPARG